MSNLKALRTKSGCFTCRARRKKCDEKKPTCLGCGRNSLACDWPMYENQSLRDFRKLTLKSIPRPENQLHIATEASRLEGLNISWQERSCLEFIMGPFVNLMCPTPAADNIRGHIRDQILRDEVFRKVSICLGYMYIPYSGTGGHQLLLKDALHSFRARLLLEQSKTITVDTLHCVTFLNLIEIFHARRSLKKVILHMHTLFQIMCTIVAHGTFQDTPIFRICADSFFYHYGLILICSSNGEFDCLPNVFSVIAIWNALSLNKVHDYNLNPVLGDKFGAIAYVNRACFIFRCALDEKKTLAFCLRLEIENTIRSEKRSSYQKLLLESAMLLLLEVAQPSHDQVRIHYHEYTSQCLAYLQTSVLDEEDLTIFWVFLICGLCIDREVDRKTFRSICEISGTKDIPNGFRIPILGLMENAWKTNEGLQILNDTKFTTELHDILVAP